MAGGEAPPKAATLEETPTWALAVVFFFLVVVSILFEHGFHLLSKFFSKRRKSLSKALYKVKSELMMLGFLTLLLTISQGGISKICISKGASESFLPCGDEEVSTEESTCTKKGKVSLMSTTGVDDLQRLIFVLAVFHVLSCLLTFGLGTAKMIRWKSWEKETTTLDYQFSNDPRRFRLTHQTSFARQHLRFWNESSILRWPACFLRLFIGSVSKADYFILRHGFIMAHFAETSRFDFQKFISRSLDKDFEDVVGMSLWVWIFAVAFLFFSAHGFHNYLWLPFVPLVILLLIGTKLQVIITKMCMDSRKESVVVRGTLLVKPDDNLFWFRRPRLLLHLMYLILFQNSFQLAFFTWTWYKYGLRSCFHREKEDIVLRIVVGIVVQFLCGYVTLPLYALVTQMGSSMNEVVFTDQVIVGLKNWHKSAKKNVAASKPSSVRPSRNTSFYNSRRSSREPSQEPSPSYTVDNSLSNGKDYEAFMTKQWLAERDSVNAAAAAAEENENVDLNEDEKSDKANIPQVYNGEASFSWKFESKGV